MLYFPTHVNKAIANPVSWVRKGGKETVSHHDFLSSRM